ncbi:MAG: hypothetical protein L0I79_07115 [Atopostipes sp.]|nr:hypothetical protein [Atopostipes sp.]
MKKILVISKIKIGSQSILYGFDDEDRLFRKAMSKRLCDHLNRIFKDKELSYEAYRDTTYHRDVSNLMDRYDLLLLSPYIVDRIDFKQLEDESYYILSIDEFEKGKTDRILQFLSNLTN